MSETDNIPQSDCAPGAIHPVASQDYFGHSDNIAALEKSLGSGRFHHGWIFAGPYGVGKATLAYHLARVLLDGHVSDQSTEIDLLESSAKIRTEKTGRLISQFAHPDMRVMRRSFDTKTKKFFRFIRIDEMRLLKEMMHTTPSMGAHRVALIDRADDMNEASSNALLKVLEEPPKHTTFILITNSPGQVPVTIRSRCRMLKFNGLELDDFKSAIEQQFQCQGQSIKEDTNWQDLLHLSGGSVRKGFELITGDGLKFYAALYKILDRLPDLDQRNIDMFVDGILKDKSGQDYQAGVQLLSDLLYRLLRGRVEGFSLSASEKELSAKLVKAHTLERWLSLWDTLAERSLDVNELNLDKKTYMLQSFFAMRDLARGAF